jgi:ankyrin repeat protein
MPGWTPLIVAAYADRTNMVHYLIETGADLNSAGNDGKTPLIWAIQLGEIPIVKELIAHGARLDATDKRGNTAFDYARTRDPAEPEIVAILEAAKKEHAGKSANK